MKKTITLLTALALAATPAFAAENCKVVRMGFNPAQDATKVLSSAKPIADYLEDAVRGIEVKASVAQDYRGLIEAMRGGQLDFAWLNPVGYVDAARENIASVLLKSSREAGPYYWAAFVVRTDSKFKTLKDLEGATIAWIDPNSAAGYLFPRATIRKNGFDPEKFFGKQVFAGGHDAAVLSVLNGSVDVAATFANNKQGTSGAWTQFVTDPAQRARFRVVAYSDAIPGDTVSVRKTYNTTCRDTVVEVQNALLNMRYKKETQKMLTDLYRINYLVPAKDSDYDIVREAYKK
jgi:phosphonate transport system substrate-binding protein